MLKLEKENQQKEKRAQEKAQEPDLLIHFALLI